MFPAMFKPNKKEICFLLHLFCPFHLVAFRLYFQESQRRLKALMSNVKLLYQCFYQF